MFIERKAASCGSSRGLINGVGINDAWYATQYRDNGNKKICPYYMTWTNILKRCYNQEMQEKRPTYKGCTVCDEWLTFSNFRRWMMTKNWNNKSIDKDILKQGNKVYCPEYCTFVPTQINTMVISDNRKNSSLPSGVFYDKSRGKFTAKLKMFGKTKFLGRYLSPTEARQIYVLAKTNHIRSVAKMYFSKGLISCSVFDALMLWCVE